jgi:hypothetical protein
MQQEVDVKLMTMIEVKDECPIILLLKIEFFQQVNKQYIPMRAGGGVCLQVVSTGRGISEP